MRIPPIGAFYHNKIEDLAEAATLASTVTHNHPAAVDSALLISHIVAYLTNGEGVDQAVQKASKLLSSDLRKNIEYVLNHQYSPPQQVASIIGASESSYETVPMAVHCLIHSPEDFEQTVIEAANLTPGDTDSIACIAGAMSGAHNGIQAIPSRFMAVEDVTYLIALADALLESSR
jgi:ADP-ribosylglycohydrolase